MTVRLLPLLATSVALVLSGCGEDKKPVFEYTTPFVTPVPFTMPGEKSFELVVHDRFAQHSPNVEVKPFTFEPTGKWNFVVISNVWSDKNSSGLAYITEMSPSFRRHKVREKLFKQLKDFRRDNNLDFEVTFIQTDSFPRQTWGMAKSSGGGSLSKGGSMSPCGWLYERCVDRYVVSPFTNDDKTSKHARREWLQPYLQFFDTYKKNLYPMHNSHGINDPESRFWDQTPAAFFMVNPEGVAVDAWIGIARTNHDRAPGALSAYNMLVHNLKLDQDDLILKADKDGKLFPEMDLREGRAEFGGTHAEIAVENILQELGTVMGARVGQ